jgi:hypothetical protein
MEILADPTMGTTQAVYLFYERIAPMVRATFETDAAIRAGFAVQEEVLRGTARTGPWRRHRSWVVGTLRGSGENQLSSCSGPVERGGRRRWRISVQPAAHSLPRHRLTSPVTFFVGENGTGKSTVIEAIAALCKLPVSGGLVGAMFMRVNSKCAHQVRPRSRAEASPEGCLVRATILTFAAFDIEAAVP